MDVKQITHELKEHAPFTAFGALTGIVFMLVFRNISQKVAYDLFYVFHPLHVLLSALTTASMYQRHQCPADKKKCNPLLILVIGYVGSIGIATLSDSIMPHIGELLLGMPHSHAHVGFIEKPWLINITAVVGIMIAYVNPTTKFPHAGHVLVSTWASIFHIMMAVGSGAGLLTYLAIFLFLFLAVWLPCCISDIVFPLLFISNKAKRAED